MFLNLEGYNITISRNEASPKIVEVENNQNLPQSVIDDYVSKYSENE